MRLVKTATELRPLAERQRGRSGLSTLRVLAAAAGSVAREQKLSAAVVFWTKTLRDPTAIAGWIEFVLKHHSDLSIPSPNARVLRKPQRNYGVTGRSVRQRTEALMAHYRFAAAQLPPVMHRELLGTRQISLGRLKARDSMFDLWLGSSLPFGQKQEGDLTVWLTNSDGVSLARMAFSFGSNAEGESTLLIGGLQGLTAGADKKVIVTATRMLSGLRPKDAVLVGVQAVAQALGIKHVLAVSNQTHVLAAEWFMSDSVISRDYDGFWVERGGVSEPGIGYRLPQRDYKARAGLENPRLIDRHRATLTDIVLTTMAGR